MQALFARREADPRHDSVEVRVAESVESSPVRLFSRWSMALLVEHHEPDVPLIATAGGLKEAVPWRITSEQEQVLTQLRDLTRLRKILPLTQMSELGGPLENVKFFCREPLASLVKTKRS